MNNPLSHVGQTARPEDASEPAQQSGDAGDAARQQNPGDAPKAPAPDAVTPSQLRKAKTEIPDLEPGQPPPESSAGS